MPQAYENIASYFPGVEIYNTAEAVYHISPEIYYTLLAGKSCSLSGAWTSFSMQFIMELSTPERLNSYL